MKQPSLKYALQGLAQSFCKQVNLRVHAFVSLVVISIAFALDISLIEWCIVLTCIGTVFVAQFFNASIGNHLSVAHSEWNDDAVNLKNIAACSVLLASALSGIIGLIVFAPRFIEKFF